MRLASYALRGLNRVGLVTAEDRLVDVAEIDAGLPATMRELLERPGALARLGEYEPATGSGVPIDDVEFASVIPDPRAIWCAALTFDSHVSEAAGREAPTYPLFFPRVQESQMGHRRPLIKPAVSEKLDYEGELALVIGRRARHVPVDEALGYVAGYSCYDEASVRDWQRHTPQIAPGKNFQATGGFGPWLVTPDEFGDPYSHSIVTRVNGEVRQRDSIDSLLFRIEYMIHYLSTMHTLLPGDVIVCGTPGGVGMRREPPVFLQAGDLVSVEIDGIGTLENTVVDEQPGTPPTWQDAAEKVGANR